MLSSELPKWCEVVFARSAEKEHAEPVEGTSLYDAALRAMEQEARSWLFDSAAPIMVRSLKHLAEHRLV